LPNQNDEATEIVVVVDQNLSVRTADAHANGLRAEEQSRRSIMGNGTSTIASIDGNALASKVGGLEETSSCYPMGSLSHGSAG